MKRKVPPKKTAQHRKSEPIIYYVSKIDFVSEPEVTIPDNFDSLEPSNFHFGFGADVKIHSDTQTVEVTIDYSFLNGEISLFTMSVRNVYALNNFNEVVEDNKLINPNFSVYLVDLSAKHCRGVQAYVTKGTPMANFPMAFIPEKDIIAAIKPE